jgi:hypothetical protein
MSMMTRYKVREIVTLKSDVTFKFSDSVIAVAREASNEKEQLCNEETF